MDYSEFICPECHQQPLSLNVDNLICQHCGKSYPLKFGIPVLFPTHQLSAQVDGREFSLGSIRKVYDKAYHHDDLMGTDFDKNYDLVTKSKLINFATPLEGKRVLDLGTGVGSLWDYIPNGTIGYALDPSVIGVAKALQKHPKLTVSASVGECIPYMDDFFDVVIAADTIEHTFSPELTLKEIHRVLKPNGILCASFPIPNSLRKWGWNQIRKRRLGLRFLIGLGVVLIKRTLLFGKPTFQPIDRDLTQNEWAELLQASCFKICNIIEWPESPEIPIVYLVHSVIK